MSNRELRPLVPGQEDVNFDGERMEEFFTSLNNKLDRFEIPEMFEGNEDELRGIISSYVLSSNDKRPVAVYNGIVETKEAFIARSLLIPVLCASTDGAISHKVVYSRASHQARVMYEAGMKARWATTPAKAVVGKDYNAFISSVTFNIANKISRDQFGVRLRKTNVRTPEPAPLPTGAVERLLPERPDMPQSARVVRGVMVAAKLENTEALGLYSMLRLKTGPTHLSEDTLRALNKLRALYYVTIGNDGDLFTDNEKKRIELLMHGHSLHDQIAHANKDGYSSPRFTERELLGGLSKLVEFQDPVMRAKELLKRLQQ